MKKFKRRNDKSKLIKPVGNFWIDGYEANVGQRVGSGQVAYELLKNLELIDQYNKYTVVLPNPPKDDLPQSRSGWEYKILKPNKLWTRIALPLALYRTGNPPDLIFTPTHYIPRFSPVKRIVTVFDLSYLRFPEMFDKKDLWQLTNWTKYSVEHAEHIITISEASKKDIIEFYKIDKKKITVAYPGYNPQLYRPIKDQEKINQVLSNYKIDSPYVLFIGTIQPRKNLVTLMEAFQKIDNVKLVVVGKTSGEGKQGWQFEQILAKPKELGIEDKVIFTGFVPDQELPYLVNGATAFVLPSLWEGFGIPAVEAMACGVPVVVSNVSSLPEVVGDAGLLVDPKSVSQIEQAIRTITTDKKLHRLKSKQGLERAKLYSWEKMAKIVLRTFERQMG